MKLIVQSPLFGCSLAVVLLTLPLLNGCDVATPTATAATAPAVPPTQVPVLTIEPVTIPRFADFVGTVHAMQAVDIRSQVTGFLASRDFEEGRVVERNAPLYRIEGQSFQAVLDQARAQVRAEEANLADREQELARFRQLVNRGGVTRAQVDTVAAQVAASRANIDALRAQVARAQTDVNFTRITAPFRGFIEATRVNPGDLIMAQQTVLTRLVQLDPIHVGFAVSRAQSFETEQLARSGQAVRRREDIQVQVLQPDGTPHPQTGFVDFASTEVDPRTDSLQVRARLPNPANSLRPGQFVRLRAIIGEAPNQILVPETAITQEQDGHYVFTVNADNRAALQKVVLGQRLDGQRIIRSGLKAQDRVITDGLIRVRPGTEIAVNSPN